MNLEQVSIFNSTNQNMCSDAGTYPGIFLDFNETYLRKTLSRQEHFAHTNFDTNILATVEKPIRSTFCRRIALHLRGFMKNEIDSCVPYNVRI